MNDISGSNTVSDGYNQPYTPTTEEVRESYVLMQKCGAYPNPDAEFDRWLDETKKLAVADFFTENGLSYRARALKEKAWQEGHDAGIEDASFEPVDHTLNPYRSWESE